MASSAEERLREKAVAALRSARPDARIIHELVLWQGGERIDLAAVWPDGMILAELKSEKDTLSRVQAQMRSARRLQCEVWLCLAEKWREPIEAMQNMQLPDEEVDVVKKGRVIYKTWKRNPAYIAELRDVIIAWEQDDGIDVRWRRPEFPPANGVAMLDMLWAHELRDLAGATPRDSRRLCINRAREDMTGREVRRACCAALMARAFPRADPPIGAARVSTSGLFTKQIEGAGPSLLPSPSAAQGGGA